LKFYFICKESERQRFFREASGSADTTNVQFWTGTSQNTGILPAGRISIREVMTKRGIYLTPRCPGLGEVVLASAGSLEPSERDILFWSAHMRTKHLDKI
jgi:hypothetical protein